MSGKIIQSVAYNNYDDFQHVNFLFSLNFISLFWRLFNDKTNLRVRYWLMCYITLVAKVIISNKNIKHLHGYWNVVLKKKGIKFHYEKINVL